MKPIQLLPLLAFCNAGLIQAQMNKETKDSRPNFIIFYTDDQRSDALGLSGEFPFLKTPHLDQLAQRGVTFTNAFVPTPICVCSRACLYSGMYTRNHRVHHFNEEFPSEVLKQSYPYLLKKAGYRTGCLGKFGIGVNDETKAMFDTWNAWAGQGDYFHEVNGERIHNSQWLADRTIDFLKESSNNPFCLTVNYKVPHHDWIPDPRDQGLFSDITILRRPSDLNTYYDNLPDTVKGSFSSTCYTALTGIGKYQEWAKQYLRCIASLDRSVGIIMDFLVKTGLDRNTVIIFLSDHGHFFGEHQLGGKWLLFEESIRIPFIMYDPRLNPEKTNIKKEEMVMNIDVAPTILDLAGVAVPAGMDGKSIKRLLNGEKTEWRDFIFMEHYYFNNLKTYINRSEGIRTKDYKYFKYVDPEPDIEVLYDLRKDPYEGNDLSTDPKYKKVFLNLQKKLDAIDQQMPNTYKEPEFR